MKEKSTRYKNYNAIPLFMASYMLFGCRSKIVDYLNQKNFFKDADEFKKNIFKNEETARGNFYIDRDFFMKFWKELSNYELIISSSCFRKKLGVNYRMFTCIVDSAQRVKGVKGSYYKLSYVNKVLKENNLPLL